MNYFWQSLFSIEEYSIYMSTQHVGIYKNQSINISMFQFSFEIL